MNKDDLISRQSAIEEIEFGITNMKAINVETGEVTEPFAKINKELIEAVDRVKVLPSAQQWHTGEPTEDGDYLVFDTEEYYTVDAFYTHNGTEEYGAYLAYKGWQSCNHVKYWMQIPKLPEVGE